MSRFRCLDRVGCAVAVCMTIGWVGDVDAQETPESKPSVIVFDVNFGTLLKSAQELGADASNLDATMPMENIVESIKPTEFKRVYGSLSLPERVDQLMTMGMGQGLPIDFYVRIEFSNKRACQLMLENVEDRSEEVELNGATYWTPEGGQTGVYGHRLNDSTFEFGSQAYLAGTDRKFLTPTLDKIWSSAPESAFRMAVDLETPADFIAQAVAMGSESGDPQVEAYLGLIDNLKSVVVTADLDSTNLLSLVAEATDVDEADEVKGGLDSLLMLAQMGGKMTVGQLAQQAPEAGKVMVQILDSLKATQDETVVRVTIPKPEGFEQAVKQAVETAKSEAAAAGAMNDFRQVALSIHNYHDAYKSFPFDVSGKDNMSNELSWLVRVLPFNEQLAIYEEMDISQGPDHEANSQFADQMPKLYGSDGKMTNVTWIKSKVQSFAQITDGTSNTVMLVEYPDGKPWLTNDGLTIDQAISLITDLDDGEELMAAFYDGSIRKLSNKIEPETLRNLFDPADGNIIEDY